MTGLTPRQKGLQPPLLKRRTEHGLAIEELCIVKTPKDCAVEALSRYARFWAERKSQPARKRFSTDQLLDEIGQRSST